MVFDEKIENFGKLYEVYSQIHLLLEVHLLFGKTHKLDSQVKMMSYFLINIKKLSFRFLSHFEVTESNVPVKKESEG